MKMGMIIPTRIGLELHKWVWKDARENSRPDTEILALLNGVTRRELLDGPGGDIPDGIDVHEMIGPFDDECDLWKWCLDYAVGKGWDWCLVLHDDSMLKEPGWEEEIEEAAGWRVALASHQTYTIWKKNGETGNVVELESPKFGTNCDPCSFGFNVKIFQERGCVSNWRIGFGFGCYETFAWCLGQKYAIRLLSGRLWHHPDWSKNTRDVLNVGANGHEDTKNKFASILPAYTEDDKYISIAGERVEIVP